MILLGQANYLIARSPKPALLVGGLLILGQLLLGMHQLGHLAPHADHGADAALDLDPEHARIQCELCAASATHGAPLPAAELRLPWTPIRTRVTVAGPRQAPLLQPYRRQIQRAPPAPLRSTP